VTPPDPRRVLGQLRRHPGATTAELATRAGLSPLATLQALATLERRGRASRTLTSHGAALLRWWPR
jgi:DNA-binding IclR family transcriptional regulator